MTPECFTAYEVYLIVIVCFAGFGSLGAFIGWVLRGGAERRVG